MGLAWNARMLDRKTVESALAEVALDVRDYAGFEHRVDRAITRDLIVATKPG
jgi:hypothetical protein